MGTLTFKRGDTLTIDGTRTDADGQAVSISGSTVRCEMVLGASRVALTCGIVDGAAGTWQATLTAEQTAALGVGIWRADPQITDAAGNVQSYPTFLIHILEDVTGAAD